MAQRTGSTHSRDRSETPGKVDLVSVLYVAGGIPAILAFLVLLFAVGVRFCGLPA
jgi:hypothetical protein